MFTLALALLGAAGIFSVPLAQANPLERGHPLTLPFSAFAALTATAALARRREIYLWLRHDRFRQVVPGLAAATLVLADGPYSPCWWIATALLLTVTTISTAGPTLIAGALTATAYAAGTLLRGKSMMPAGDTEYLTVTASLLANPLIARAVIEGFARFVLRLHKLEQEATEARQPIRVSATILSPDTDPQAEGRQQDGTRRSSRYSRTRGTSGLTARQLEVVQLARDGLHQPEIAACLGISPRQVERHLKQARRHTGAATTAQLVVMLVTGRPAPAMPTGRPAPP